MSDTLSCPSCGSANVVCVTSDDLIHDHRCYDCGHTTIPCPICDHADQTGSWADAPGFSDMTHCRKCHQSWKRQTEFQHCTGCHRTFTNVSAADIHRDGRQCIDPATIVTKAGKARLARSTKRLDPRSTIELWAHGGERPRSGWGSEIHGDRA